MFGGTAHVVLGSGLTIAGATYCLSFTRVPYFQSMGVPLAIGMVICVVAALTLGPAIITIASRFGKVLEPKRAMRVRGWRKIGAGSADDGAHALQLRHDLLRPQVGPPAGDRLHLVQRAAGVAETAAGELRDGGAARGDQRAEREADLVADPAG